MNTCHWDPPPPPPSQKKKSNLWVLIQFQRASLHCQATSLCPSPPLPLPCPYPTNSPSYFPLPPPLYPHPLLHLTTNWLWLVGVLTVAFFYFLIGSARQNWLRFNPIRSFWREEERMCGTKGKVSCTVLIIMLRYPDKMFSNWIYHQILLLDNGLFSSHLPSSLYYKSTLQSNLCSLFYMYIIFVLCLSSSFPCYCLLFFVSLVLFL